MTAKRCDHTWAGPCPSGSATFGTPPHICARPQDHTLNDATQEHMCYCGERAP